MLSIIVPVFNSQKYLENCIQSIRNQTFQDIEIICIDDGSTDESGRILDRIASYDNRMVVIHQNNAGVSYARNIGLKVAKGEFITFVDSDDEIDKEMYSVLLDELIQTNSDIVHCGYKKIHLDGTSTNVSGTYEIIEQDSNAAVRSLLNGRCFAGGIWNKIYRRNIICNTVFQTDLKINEDILFNFEAFTVANKITFMDYPLYMYYERPASACFSTGDIKKAHDCCSVSRRMWELSRGKSYCKDAADRYYSSLINEYRSVLFANESKDDLALIRKQLSEVEKMINSKPLKYKVNNLFMLNTPSVYLGLYKVYDKLRTPNWDIKR